MGKVSKIKTIRVNEGLSKKEMSKLTKIPYKRYKLIEKDQSLATKDELFVIAHYLDIPKTVFGLDIVYRPRTRMDDFIPNKNHQFQFQNPTLDTYKNFDINVQIKNTNYFFLINILFTILDLLFSFLGIWLFYNRLTYNIDFSNFDNFSFIFNQFINEEAYYVLSTSFALSLVVFFLSLAETFNFKIRMNILTKILSNALPSLMFIFMLASVLVLIEKYKNESLDYFNYTVIVIISVVIILPLFVTYRKVQFYKSERIIFKNKRYN